MSVNHPTTDELVANALRSVQSAKGMLEEIQIQQNKYDELRGVIEEQRHTIQTLTQEKEQGFAAWQAQRREQSHIIGQLRTQKDNQRQIIMSYIESHRKLDTLLQNIQADSSVHDILIALGKVLEVVRAEEEDPQPQWVDTPPWAGLGGHGQVPL